MLDELISCGGHRESLTLQQIQSFVAMDSNEEKIQRIIAEVCLSVSALQVADCWLFSSDSTPATHGVFSLFFLRFRGRRRSRTIGGAKLHCACRESVSKRRRRRRAPRVLAVR